MLLPAQLSPAHYAGLTGNKGHWTERLRGRDLNCKPLSTRGPSTPTALVISDAPPIHRIVRSGPVREHAQEQPGEATEAEHEHTQNEADKRIFSVQLQTPRGNGSSGIEPPFECVDRPIRVRKAAI